MIAGQASVEYAGLLGIAAMLGAGLALAAGPPLAGAVRGALVSALSGATAAEAPPIASAADIADIQPALVGGDDTTTPAAALVALTRRHSAEQAGAIASAVLLDAARAATPALGERRSYRPWTRPEDGPYGSPAGSGGDRDVEEPTGAPVAVWVTVAAQRRAVAAGLAHHANLAELALDAVALIPTGSLLRLGAKLGERSFEKLAFTSARDMIEGARMTLDAVEVVEWDDGDLPPGMRAGDVVVAWPVHRTAWRGGRIDQEARIDSHGFGSVRLFQDYTHLLFLRPSARGLAVVAEGFGT
jgi:hypothetical protein